MFRNRRPKKCSQFINRLLLRYFILHHWNNHWHNGESVHLQKKRKKFYCLSRKCCEWMKTTLFQFLFFLFFFVVVVSKMFGFFSIWSTSRRVSVVVQFESSDDNCTEIITSHMKRILMQFQVVDSFLSDELMRVVWQNRYLKRESNTCLKAVYIGVC